MSAAVCAQTQIAKPPGVNKSKHAELLLQRKCACGSPTASLTGECSQCSSKTFVQAKLHIGASNDPLEQEADRIADQALATSLNSDVSGMRSRIQRFSGESSRRMGAVAASADHLRAGPGGPLELALRQYRLSRFGHDFGRVRVHTDLARTPPMASRRFLEFGDSRMDSVPLDNTGTKVEAKPADKGPDAPACAEAIKWKPNSPVPVEIMADNVADFAARIDAALAGTPHMSATASWDSVIEAGKVSAVNLTLETTIIRPRYGGGRASDEQKKLIQRVVEFIKTHEEKHRDASRAVWQQVVCDALGKSPAEANKILEKARCSGEPKAQAAIDAVEGKIDWIMNAAGTEVIDFKAVGIQQNYKPGDCK
ncbi:MAG: DUF922 domain-containing protein [Porticoccaceae bacterium]